jgi:hypothetical protein
LQEILNKNLQKLKMRNNQSDAGIGVEQALHLLNFNNGTE